MEKYRNQKLEALWLSTSPYLKGFDQRLLVQLAKANRVRRWEYCQTADEPCCIESAVETLHDYMTGRIYEDAGNGTVSQKENQPIHLLGHGVSGVLGLLYARKYPQQIASLTLLSVSSQPAIDWQSHYYTLKQLLPCSREMMLVHVARLLFGEEPSRYTKALATLLARDLDSSLTLHSLARYAEVETGNAGVPLLVCNGAADVVVSQKSRVWEECLGSRDRLWHCPHGNHFFHFHHPEATANTIISYWQQLLQVNQEPKKLRKRRIAHRVN